LAVDVGAHLLDITADTSQVSLLPNPSNQFFFELFVKKPVHESVANVRTHARVLQIDDQAVPVTVNWHEYDNAFVCSPYASMFRYLYEEMHLLGNSVFAKALKFFVWLCSFLLKVGRIDRVVQINNWLISTNLHPKFGERFVRRARDFLVKQYPTHAVVYRSLTRETNGSLIRSLELSDFLLIPSRQVYLFDGRSPDFLKKRMTKADLALLRKTELTLVEHDEFLDSDYQRMVVLYRQLYIDKHSTLNPMFTAKYIRECHRNRALTFFGLRDKEGMLQGVIGMLELDGTMATHFIGYNTQLPQDLGLYRILIAWLLQQAATKQMLLNLSSGAAHFKLLRGGKPITEYMAVYEQHLPVLRRLLFRVLQLLSRHVALPIMRAYKV
jgi:hypothetical protein